MRWLTAIVLFLMVAATPRTQTAAVTGTITFRERIALPRTAVVDVTIEDVSRADRAFVIVASTRVVNPGQPPIRFRLPFDPARINASNRYAVRARILQGDRVLFSTSQTTLVITQGHGVDVNLLVTMVSSAGPVGGARETTPDPADRPSLFQRPQAPPARLVNLPATFIGVLPCPDCPGVRYQLNLFADDSFFLRRTYVDRPNASTDDIGTWVLSSDRRVLVLQGRAAMPEYFAIREVGTLRKLDVEGREITSSQSYDLRRVSQFQTLDVRTELAGVYRPAAGGGAFVDCATGHEWLVEGKPADFEPRYRQSVRRAGEALFVTVRGRLTTGPGSGAPAPNMNVVIEQLLSVNRGATCPARFAAATFANTTWVLTRLGERPIPPAQVAARQPLIAFRDEPATFSGSGGCNRLTGTYLMNGDQLTMSGVGTLRACQTATDVDAAFRSALDAVRSYRVLGRTLDLYDRNGRVLARFSAR